MATLSAKAVLAETDPAYSHRLIRAWLSFHRVVLSDVSKRAGLPITKDKFTNVVEKQVEDAMLYLCVAPYEKRSNAARVDFWVTRLKNHVPYTFFSCSFPLYRSTYNQEQGGFKFCVDMLAQNTVADIARVILRARPEVRYKGNYLKGEMHALAKNKHYQHWFEKPYPL